MVILEIKCQIPKTEDEASSLARCAVPWNEPFDLVAFCYRGREKLFNHHTGEFV